MKNDKHTKNNKIILWGLLFFAALCFIFVLVYKAQLREKFTEPVTCTMKSLYKANGSVLLSDETSILKQTFTCTVPSLEGIRIECQGGDIGSGSRLLMLLLDAQTGEEYFRQESAVSKIASKSSVKKISLNLETPIEDSEGKILTLLLQLSDGNGTALTITSNTKQGIVQSFNDIEADKSNIIYDITYSDCGDFIKLYVLLCMALLLFGSVCFYLFLIRRKTISQAYVPLAIILGIIFNFVIMVNGVPDEPAHIDTAYRYSDIMMGNITENVGTIYKRQCDIEMTDMLVNGVESNSYYQLLNHFFELPENTELVEVSALNVDTLVPGIIYIPSAIGISIGRLLGLSALFTLTLGRIMNLLVFIFLTWLAIQMLPYGKNMLAMVMLLPISLQQAASFSYDAAINGVIALFLALCFHLAGSQVLSKWKLFLLTVLTIFLATSKGGIYLPLCLLWLLIFQNYRRQEHTNNKSNKKVICLLLSGALLLIAALLVKFLPLFTQLFSDNQGETVAGTTTFYNVGYLIQYPVKILYLYWNTFMKKSDILLQGLLGGRLAWLNVSINWVYLIILLLGSLLLVNVKEDKYVGNRKQKILLVIVCFSSSALIVMSMLLSYTAITLNFIEGLQGRYFLPLFPLLLFLTSNRMVSVGKEECCKISMAMMITEIMILLNAVTSI